MPYTEKKTRAYFDEHPFEAKDPGDLTFVVYKPVYKLWKEEPRYKTYFSLLRGQRNVKLIPPSVLQVMIGLNKGGASTDDVFTAYDCAVLELWTRHVSCYEAKKLEENGDVEV